MAVIFQLFSVQDLQALTAQQLEELRAWVGMNQRTPQPQVADTVYQLASIKYEQLTGQKPKHPRPTFNPGKGLLGQLFHQDDLACLKHKDYTILQWAVECALAHQPEAVGAINTQAVEMYKEWTGTTPQGPDLPWELRRARMALHHAQLAAREQCLPSDIPPAEHREGW
jgi:hypothetical protein